MAGKFVVGDWPQEAPEGWIIQNAPRPLWGHKAWQDDFVCGVFFVAIDMDLPDAADMIKNNRELGAVELSYVSEDTAVQESYDFYRQNHPKIAEGLDLSDPDTRQKLITTWIDHANSPKFQVGSFPYFRDDDPTFSTESAARNHIRTLPEDDTYGLWDYEGGELLSIFHEGREFVGK